MYIHETVKVPDDVNIFFLGDIHGCNKMMMDALKLAGYDKYNDYVFCVGDLIDRGPENLEVLAKFLYNPKFRAVRGNHDQFMIVGDYNNWQYNGGMWAFEKLDTDTIKSIAEDMDTKLPVFMTVEHRGNRYGLVHAGVPFKYKTNGNVVHTPVWDDIINVIENDAYPEYLVEPYLWDRDVIQEVCFNLVKQGLTKGHRYFDRYNGFKDELTVDIPPVGGVDYIMHGHTGIPEPLRYGNRVYLDTGGVFNGKLTAACPTGGRLYCYTTDPDDPCGTAVVL